MSGFDMHAGDERVAEVAEMLEAVAFEAPPSPRAHQIRADLLAATPSRRAFSGFGPLALVAGALLLAVVIGVGAPIVGALIGNLLEGPPPADDIAPAPRETDQADPSVDPAPTPIEIPTQDARPSPTPAVPSDRAADPGQTDPPAAVPGAPDPAHPTPPLRPTRTRPVTPGPPIPIPTPPSTGPPQGTPGG